ncbi:MAG: hypothetical protein MMC23_002831 [Stictis urceolatum]|nr:hypothetical protein [Stictis urceolata]
MFLTKTKGTTSIPYFEGLMNVYTGPEFLATTNPESLVPFIRPLGLQNKRAEAIPKLARAWLDQPPTKDQRWRRLCYPTPKDGRDIKSSEQPLPDSDPRSAWEIAHLPGLGAYALDSWRIFCRDDLRGVSSGLTALRTQDDIDDEWEQEWTRVSPGDKELRAYVKWRWLRLGYFWEPITGAKKRGGADVIAKMEKGELQEWEGWVNPWLGEGKGEGNRASVAGDIPMQSIEGIEDDGIQGNPLAILEGVDDDQAIDEAVAMLSSDNEIFDLETNKP